MPKSHKESNVLYDMIDILKSNMLPTNKKTLLGVPNEFKIQYKTFNNTSQGSYSWGGTHGGYSTIGLENHMSNIGLQYTFFTIPYIVRLPLCLLFFNI